jgi:hypothetical protein
LINNIPIGNPTNSSTSLGPLGPASPNVLDDLALDSALAAVIAGITGMDQSLVIPRDQPGSGFREPDVQYNWVSVGVMTSTPMSTRAIQAHNSDGDGSTALHQYYTLDVLASCYGPKSNGIARLIFDAFDIEQNRFALRAVGLNFLDVEPIRKVPGLVAAGIRRRSDLSFRLVQSIERVYLIRNILGARGTVVSANGPPEDPDTKIQPFKTRLPSPSTSGGS